MSFLTLPEELVREIAQYFSPTQYARSYEALPRRYYFDSTLRSLCTVNRRLRAICLPVQFQNVTIRLDSDTLRTERDYLKRALLSCPNITACLRYGSHSLQLIYDRYTLTSTEQ